MIGLQKWIGLAEVHPLAGSNVFGPSRQGALVNIIACAQNADEFRNIATEACRQYGLELITLDDTELLSERMQHSTVDEVLLSDAERVPHDTTFVFGNFHTYPLD